MHTNLSRRHFLGSSAALGALALTGCQSNASGAAELPFAATDGNGPLALNFNENSLGLPPASQQALAKALPNAFRYPDQAKSELMASLASHHQISADQLIYGNGSSEILKMAVDAMAEPGAQLVMPDPTYGVAEDYALARGLKVVKVPLTSTFETDIAAMKAAVAAHPGKSVVYLCNPNNPTGLMLPQGELANWLAQGSDALSFILDEAYAEYVNDPAFVSAIGLTQTNPHLVVARTFSKIYALAGLRVGYGVAHPSLIKAMAAQASIDNANLAGCVAAKAALEDKDWVAHSRRSNQDALALVMATLEALGLKALPCNANFLFHEVKGDTAQYQQRMADAGILVGRAFNHSNGWNRLSLGRPDEMKRFCQTLIQFRQKGWV
ncbi:aminotransferase class I and II [Ferrimonas balearica DSM 9799]|uniref:Aminotransferase class I and II n=1 Tax=Ferrimonas balearica (strain DSM 9799 / CCM 4581 / KCTC 23876 / PAT) TaxID=550540 RepID=E1SNU8_FERBD|nr:histidinol-phosphate transaminase [Ferrimonas balearica]ADN77755.1 aminotransferase class I and II [Ferrimonas balearica DSM 9799]